MKVSGMSRVAIFRIIIAAAFFGPLAAVGCRPVYTQEKRSFVCIHSYDDSGQDGEYFRSYMNDAFKRQKINADVTHIYLDLITEEEPAESLYGDVAHFVQAVLDCKPEVLLINDDLAMEYIYNKCDTLLKTQPAVFAGVSAPRHWDRGIFPLISGITDRVSLSANCELLNQITGTHSVMVELGFGGYQDRLRRLLFDNIGDTTRFVNNADFYIDHLSEDSIQKQYGGLMVVSFLSMENPEDNRMLGTDAEEGLLNSRLAKISATTSSINQIQVKYDIFSNEVIDSDPRPQVTSIREQFGSEGKKIDKKVRTRFLCGYFTSVETQIDDQVGYAARIIEGAPPASLPLIFHDQNFYMDWIAMTKCDPPLGYDEYKSKFTIINAPFNVSHRRLFIVGIVLLTLLALGLVICLSVVFLRKKKRQKKQQIETLRTEIEKRTLTLEDLETGFFMLKGRTITFYFGFAQKQGLQYDSMSLDDLRWAVHPDSVGIFRDILADPNGKTKKSKIRIRLDFNGKGWHWWNLYFDTMESDKNAIVGSIINIDDVAKLEAQALDAAIKAEEVLSKENFIANITHDIRTPLNAITGFSELLLDPGQTPEDRAEYMDIISTNTEQMINLLEEAAVMQSDSTESMSFKFREVNLPKLVDDSYKTNKILCPQHLVLKYEPDSRTDVMVRCDPVRTTQVINNFLSNAFKYTPSGSVTFGWEMTDNGTMAKVYVKDTGVGISDEDKKVIGERFGMAKGNRKGTGLGLDICQKIISAEDGEYGFESELGKGSCFHFSLPVLVKEEKQA
ncbi:MAG: HAMP domain-containing histidine kinase [Bacteroidales bacterium]|nr:HAMP domain-containing histidine kinase [Bacteroidales bacterium]